MPRRAIRQRRAPMEWAVRVVLALALAYLGAIVVVRSYAYAIRRSAPERAYDLAPRDGRIAAALSEQLSGPEATAADRRRADKVALLALRREPTAVQAVSTLGVDAVIRGDPATAKRWFGYAQLLSRRDLRTQLWGIEDAVARGDVPGALHHYDVALRTSRLAADLLFPVLTSAIADPKVRAAVGKVLSREPIWNDRFIDYAADHGSDPQTVALLFQDLARTPVTVPDQARAIVVQRLIAAGRYDQAWTYYASLHTGADRRRSRDPGFSASPGAPAPFDWMPVNDGGITATIGGGMVDFSAPSSVGGVMLRQIQMLPPGSYVLEGRSLEIEQPDDARPYWRLACLDDRELGRTEIPNSAQAGGRFAGRFMVPSNCPVQELTLVAQPTGSIGGLAGRIDAVALRPAHEG